MGEEIQGLDPERLKLRKIQVLCRLWTFVDCEYQLRKCDNHQEGGIALPFSTAFGVQHSKPC